MAKSQSRPKRALNPYCIFVKEMRKTKEGRDLSFSEYAKLCAAKWKNMSKSQKDKYKMKAAIDNQRYQNEKKKFVSKSMTSSKKPMSAFFHYCNYERPRLKAKHPNWTIVQLARELGRRWKYASATLKLRFQKIAQKKKKERNGKKEQFRESRNNRDDDDERDSDTTG